jgi:hypothetical protein
MPAGCDETSMMNVFDIAQPWLIRCRQLIYGLIVPGV